MIGGRAKHSPQNTGTTMEIVLVTPASAKAESTPRWHCLGNDSRYRTDRQRETGATAHVEGSAKKGAYQLQRFARKPFASRETG